MKIGRRRGEFEPQPHRETVEGIMYDPLELFLVNAPHMIGISRQSAMEIAVSYRDLKVGASLIGGNADGSETTIIGGANYKPHRKSRKYCAEMDILDRAEESGLEHVTGMVIAGPEDPKLIKEILGFEADTIHPCRECRNKMSDSSLITSDTIVMNVGLEKDIAQVYTFGDLQILYDLEEEMGIDWQSPTVDLDLKNWHRRQFFYGEAVSHSDNHADPVSLAKLALTSTIEIDQ